MGNFSFPILTYKQLRNHWLADLRSGFVVFLVSLPLCLAVAQASGFPAVSALYTSILGGLVISFLSGSRLGIKGAPAGLSAIALGAVVELGNGDSFTGYRMALAAIVAGGVLQIILGMLKAGALADFFPASAIHGMLGALGLTIAIFQIPVLLGVVTKNATPLDFILDLPAIFRQLNPKVALVGTIALACLVICEFFKEKKVFRYMPPPLLALVVASIASSLLGLHRAHSYSFVSRSISDHLFVIDPQQLLVTLPSRLWTGITFPDFSHFYSLASIKYILLFAFVGSIESILSTKAVERLDPEKRLSQLSQDLFAIGVGNVVSGLLGGLAMITAIRRSVVNVNAGAETQWSNFFHAAFLLVLLLVAAPLIEFIPYSALSALLIFAGFKLITPAELFKSYKIGPEQALVFFTTLFAIVFFGLLPGILLGVATEVMVHLFFGVPFHSLFHTGIDAQKDEIENSLVLKISGSAIFSNYFQVRKLLKQLPSYSNVIFDFSNAVVVDHSFLEHIYFFEADIHKKGGQIEIRGLDYHKNLSQHPLASKRIIKATYTNRHVALQAFAEKGNWTFDPRRVMNLQRYEGFSFSTLHTLHWEENILAKGYKSYQMEFSDLRIKNRLQPTHTENTVTKLLLTGFWQTLPDFTIEKEGFGQSILNTEASGDINFDAYPNFSFYYLLKGTDEYAVRRFFTPSMVAYFENNKGYAVEVKNGTVLILRKLDVLTVEELERMEAFAKGLMALL